MQFYLEHYKFFSVISILALYKRQNMLNVKEILLWKNLL